MAKVLLTTLNSQYLHSSLALMCLYSSYMENSLEGQSPLDMREFNINQQDDFIINEILFREYQVICFSVNIWNVERTKDISRVLKKANPQLIIVFGGPEVSFDSLDFMKANNQIDILVIGEGELAFTRLCESDFELERVKNIPGIIYRDRFESKIYVNDSKPMLNMDSLPFPYKYGMPKEEKILYYESARGCPYSCSYCMSSLEKGVRSLPEERIKEEMQFFLDRDVRIVKLVDRTFNWDNIRSYRLLKYLIDNDNGVTCWHFELAADLIDDSLKDLISIARPGLFQFEIGIQSTNVETLKAVSRKHSVGEVLRRTADLIELGNCHIHTDLIVGLPYEDYLSVRKSFNEVYNLKADHFQLGFLKLLKGTRIRKEAGKFGYYYLDKAPYTVIRNDFLTATEIVGLKHIESILNLFYNRGGFEKTLDYLTRLKGTPFDFFEEFARFYQLKGFQEVSHKKEDLYKILRSYVFWKTRGNGNILEKASNMLIEDMNNTLNEDIVKKFNRKGWDI